MHKRVYDFFISHNIIYEHQFGFQKNKSTSLAVLDIYSKLIKSIENKEFSCCIFLDFAKAFDTVNHEILLSKLEHYGITGIVNDWFRSYLSLRPQKVKINGFLSDEQYIKCGVPQGSVLGPLLFLIYINDMPYASTILDIHLFVDDTSIFMSNKNLEELQTIVNSELVNISDWLISNKLTLNVSKSNFIIIHPPQRKRNKQVTIKINGENLEEKSHTKYLGVLIDKNLNWKAHTHHINLKLAKGLGMIVKIRHFIPSSVLRNIYYAFIHAHINYAILNWGSATPTNLEPIKVSMRKADGISGQRCSFRTTISTIQYTQF